MAKCQKPRREELLSAAPSAPLICAVLGLPYVGAIGEAVASGAAVF
jgi:hypothetical protein